jgi:hypothetical protein
VEEEDDCRLDVVELVRINVAEVCNATNSDDYLSGGGAEDIAAEPHEVIDAHKDGWAVTSSSTPSFPSTTVVLILPLRCHVRAMKMTSELDY